MSKHIDYEINRELGECYLFMGDLDKAAEYYTKALDCETTFAAPYLGLATISVQKGDMAGATGYYRKAAGLEASDKAFAGLALVDMDEGRHEEAFKNFHQALEHNPLNLIALNGLVQEGYHLSRLPEVLPRLESALGLSDNETVRFALAGCLRYLGRSDEARAQLEILLGRNPQHTSAQELYASIAA